MFIFTHSLPYSHTHKHTHTHTTTNFVIIIIYPTDLALLTKMPYLALPERSSALNSAPVVLTSAAAAAAMVIGIGWRRRGKEKKKEAGVRMSIIRMKEKLRCTQIKKTTKVVQTLHNKTAE